MRELPTTLPNGWTVKRLSAFARVTSGGTPSRTKAEYWGGDVPWVTTGEINFNTITRTEEHITAVGVANSSAKVFPKGTLLMAMFGQGVTRGKVAILGVDAAFNQACVAILPNDRVSSRYLFHYFAQNYDFIRGLSNTGSQANLNGTLIRGLDITLPAPDEACAIATIADTIDRVVDQVWRLVKARRKLKRGLMQQLLTGQRRFPEFRKQPWRECRLRDVAEECNEPGRGALGREHIMGVTKSNGIVPMEDRLIGNVDRYQVVRKEWYAYNPMRLNIGSIARWQKNEPVLVSPDYVVFRCRDGELDPAFLDQYRRGHLWESFMRVCGAGSVRVRIYFKDLGRHKMHLPPIEEQRRIASALETLDDELAQLRRLHDALKQQKKGLMQRLLTGKVRVPPSILKQMASKGRG